MLAYSIFNVLLLLVLTLNCPNLGKCENAGVAVRINEAGLEEVSRFAVEIFKRKLNLQNLEIPNIEKSNYQVHDIRITSVDPGELSIDPSAPNSVVASIRGANVKASAAYSVSLSFFGTHGIVDASLNGISISQQVLVGRNANGAPTFTVGRCTAAIDSLDLTVQNPGFLSWLISSVVQALDGIIKKEMDEKICPGISKELTHFFNEAQSDFPVNVPIKDLLVPFDDINVNVGLTSAPLITDSSITVEIAGRCFNTQFNPNQQFTFLPPSLPNFSQSNQMAQGILNQYVLNTLLFSLWQTNQYAISIGQEQINAMGIDVSAGSLAEHIPEFEDYSNRSIQFDFRSPDAFRISINSSGITGIGRINMKVSAVLPDNTLETVVAVNFSAEATIQLVINETTLYANMTKLVVRSIDTSVATAYFEGFFEGDNSEIIQRVNERMNEKKARLLIFQQFLITQPSIDYLENAIEAGGSVSKV